MASPGDSSSQNSAREDSSPRLSKRQEWRRRLANSFRRRRPQQTRTPYEDASSFVYTPAKASQSSHRKHSGRGSPLFSVRIGSGSRQFSCPNLYPNHVDCMDGEPNDLKGGTPLHYFVWFDKRKERLDFLVGLITDEKAPVDVNAKTDEGNTALHLAVKRGDINSVKVLLSFGADVNTLDNRGQTPTDIATMCFLNQERKLQISNSAVNQRHNSAPAAKIDRKKPSGSGSPALSKVIPPRPKLVDYNLDGDFEGWVNVDFTAELPPLQQPKEMSREARVRDLTDPVQITLEDVQRSDGRSVSDAVDKETLEEGDEELHQAYRIILDLLHATGGMSSAKLQHVPNVPGMPLSLSGKHGPDLAMELERSIRLREYDEGSTILSLYEAMEDTINRQMEQLSSLGSPDEAMALAMQQHEMKLYEKTQPKPVAGMEMEVHAGSRILCLDGGGIRGLIQIEVLSQIERKTGRRITDLFDWIVGTSTGALIALCLVYCNMSLDDIRLLYFKLKSDVFTGNTYAFDTKALERILQEAFPSHMCMDCVQEPKVLVSAVYKKTAPLQLHFFNNCFGDEYSKQPVWKVARYTSAAPMFFKECDNYVDGGVLANNPSESGLTAIQNFHHAQGLRLPISLVVSVGSGVYPAENLGKIDVQDFLFFGKQWLNPRDTVRKRAKNLIQLLSNALVESETVADNTKARCEGQGTPFFRFSPNLAETVATGETHNLTLIDMIISTMVQTVPRMDELVQVFYRVAGANQKERYRKQKQKLFLLD